MYKFHMRTFIFIVFILTCSVAFANLSYFDKKMITENRIKEIQEIITENINNDNSCTTYRYRFDSSGNIISEDLLRTGTIYGYHYDTKGKIKDWSWKDKESGEVSFFSEIYETEPEKFITDLLEKENRLKKLFDNKVLLSETTTRKITDICANIDGVYSVKLLEKENSLPAIFEATLEKNGEHTQSPQKLYIIYKYDYFK